MKMKARHLVPLAPQAVANRAEYLRERTRAMRAWAHGIDVMRKGGKVLPLHQGKMA